MAGERKDNSFAVQKKAVVANKMGHAKKMCNLMSSFATSFDLQI
jgi:hypothetical protein